MSGRAPLAVRLCGAFAGLLPPDMRRDRDQVRSAFAALWEETPAGRARASVAARAFGALSWVLVMEWLEFLGARRAPGRTRRGRGGVGL